MGQHEFQQFNEQHIEKGKVMKIAKYLNRLVLVSGLEMATGARVERDAPENNIYIYIYIYKSTWTSSSISLRLWR